MRDQRQRHFRATWRYVFGEGEPEGHQSPQPVRRQTAEVGSAQRFGTPPPQVDDDEPVEVRSKAYVILGVVAIALVLILVGVLFSMFRGG